MRDKHNGFTLIELSIVLVIIGLLVGGVLVGRTLIKAAEVRKAASTHTQFVTAWNTFKLKFNCVPGDCAAATSWWGVDNLCATLPGSASTTGTCIGNGDGKVNWTATVAGSIAEAAIVFNHLHHAKLWNHQLGDDSFPYYTPPHWNKTDRATFTVGSSSVYAQMYGGVAPNGVLMRGNGAHSTRRNTIGGNGPQVALETALFTQVLDQKIDDGQPQSGKFQSSNGYILGTGNFANCILADGVGDWAYNVTNTDITCRFVQLLDY